MNTELSPRGREQSDSRTTAVQSTAAESPNTIPRTFPTHGTQGARFLAALLAGREINPLLAWRDFGIYRVSDVVFRLRKLGWPVETDDLTVQNRFNEGCVVALYSLAPDVTVQAGVEAQQFITDERETLRKMRGVA